jgi:competence protein ComEC
MFLQIIHTWKKAPFIRILIPLMTGIIIQWHLQIELEIVVSALLISFIFFIGFFFIPFIKRYEFSALSGLFISFLFASFGALLAWENDIRHNATWFGSHYSNDVALKVTILEPPVEKTKSFKTTASVDLVLKNEKEVSTSGKIIIYFKKDSNVQKLSYGSQLIFKKSLQEIKNSGNPGGFDYKRYSLFQSITHQVYLKENEFEILNSENKEPFTHFIFSTREKVLQILRTNIKGDKELGLAEALLIGYKDDLDKTLVQSYSNTGVVHVIAISGLHLGLIYWLLLLFFRPLQKRKNKNLVTIRWLRPVLIIAGLWLFSLLAGAQPSVLRSAVMFTCIVLGESYSRKTSIFNTLAFSAFLLLCYNPYWLWDVGFQLSYSAVLSIVIFMRPIYNWFYIKNKALDFLWKLNAVTIAAQILTLPISIYHFHQFPNYFLLTNFVAVPLSSLILLGEILLCSFSFIPAFALFVGKVLSWMIRIMNSYVEQVEHLPFSLWDGLQVSIPQVLLLVILVSGLGFWSIEKTKAGLKIALIALSGFILLRSVSFIKANNQKKLIVYNVPQKPAIDIIDGRKYMFTGDSELLADDFIRNFHLKPSRIFHRIEPADPIAKYFQNNAIAFFGNKKILKVDTTIYFKPIQEKISLEMLIVSKNPKLYFKKLSETFNIKQVVFDGSVPSWKMKYWKKDCDSLQIPYYDVSEKGAFVMNLN